jgi:dihydroorotate dehydrogenase electron transfer subunit
VNTLPPSHEQHDLAVSRDFRVCSVRHYGGFAAVSLIAAELAHRCTPGQFVMVAVPGGGALLRRPLSLYRVDGDVVSLLIEARGAGSARLTAVEVGDWLAVAGPLGHGFDLTGVTDALLIGGGIGTAPLQYLADVMADAGVRASAAFGFRDHRQARLVGAFTIANMSVASEDGVVGRRGTVLDLLNQQAVRPQSTLFVCGPSAMIAAVQSWAAARGLRGQASLEAHMACGSGSCHGCVVATNAGLLRVCSEGPVFALDSVVI